MAARRCKAKAKTTKKRCTKRGGHVCAKCGVCRVHGCNCKNPGGAPKGSSNGSVSSIYSKGLLDDEVELFGKIDVAGLDDEIRMAKLMLRRAIVAQSRVQRIREIAEQQGDSATPESVAMELTRLEFTADEAPDPDRKGGKAKPEPTTLRLTKRVFEGRDYWNEVQRFLGRIERLTATRATMGGNAGIDAMETARQIQEALSEIEATTHGEADA
jgi:hypothetical protein